MRIIVFAIVIFGLALTAILAGLQLLVENWFRGGALAALAFVQLGVAVLGVSRRAWGRAMVACGLSVAGWVALAFSGGGVLGAIGAASSSAAFCLIGFSRTGVRGGKNESVKDDS